MKKQFIFFTVFILFIFLIIFLSCSKENNIKKQQEDKQLNNNDTEVLIDTNLTTEEKFTISILTDFLKNSDDEDLASFLETEVYKMKANYKGAAVVEITPSTWIIELEIDGNVKNYILQKYVDFGTNEYYFTMKETILTIPDIITSQKSKLGQ